MRPGEVGLLSGGRTLLPVYAAMFMSMLGFGIILPVLPFHARMLGASPVAMSLLVTLFALAQFLTAPAWGALSDRYGRRPIIALGLTGYGLSFLLMGVAPSVGWLLTVRTLGGVCSGSVFPTVLAHVADVTPPQGRAAAMGRVGAAANVGYLSGPLLGGALAALGPRAGLMIAGGVVFLSVLASAAMPRPDRASPDCPGTAPRRQVGLPGPLVLMTALSGPLAAFYLQSLALTLTGAAVLGTVSYYMMDRFQSTAAGTSLFFVAQGVSAASVQALLVEPALRRWGEDSVLRWGLALRGLGFLGMLLAPAPGLLLASAAVCDGGGALCRPVLNGAVSRRSGEAQGLAMGTMASFDSLGRVLGPLWAGWVYSRHISAPFASGVAVSAFALVLALSVARQKRLDLTRPGTAVDDGS